MTAPPRHEDPKLPREERIRSVGYDYAAEPKGDIVSCNLCGADDWVVIAHRDRYGYPAQTMSCRRCSLTMLNPRMSAEAYGRFYDGVYRPLVSAFHGRRIDAITIQDEQRVYAAMMADFVRPLLGDVKGRPFLDVGGSTGIVAATFAKAFGLRATVIDPAPAELAEARAQGVEVVRAFVEDWDPGALKFSCIGMFQTIDHLLDVSGTLAKLRSLIANDGMFIVDVVDFRAAYLRAWSVEQATKIDHVYSLTERTTEVLLARAGFHTVRKHYSPDHLHVAFACRPAPIKADAMPDARHVEAFFDEVRFVHNAPAPPR